MQKYKLVQKLGEGGMGQVFRAQQTDLDRPVAIKFLLEGVLEDATLRYGLSSGPILANPRSVVIEWEPGAYASRVKDGPRPLTVHPSQDPERDLLLLHGDTREDLLGPGRRHAAFAAMGPMDTHWFSEPPIDIEVPDRARIRWAALYAIMDSFAAPTPMRVYIRPPGTPRWEMLADLRAGGELVHVWHGIDPRLLPRSLRLRTELLHFEDWWAPDQRGYFKHLAIHWEEAPAATSAAARPVGSPGRR